MLINNGIIAIK